jgi:hypothetical protein
LDISRVTGTVAGSLDPGVVSMVIEPEYIPGVKPVGLTVTVRLSGARPKSGVTVSQPCGTEFTLVTESGSALEAVGSETVTFTGEGKVELT